jgi:tetratricopeptide (TPR) repeat protein
MGVLTIKPLKKTLEYSAIRHCDNGFEGLQGLTKGFNYSQGLWISAKFGSFGSMLIIFLTLFSCVGITKPSLTDDHLKTFAEKYRSKALEHENQGDLPKALFSWKIVSRFTPQDLQASKAVRRLQQRMENEANNHYQKGVQFYRSGSRHSSRREFLMALACNPEHKEALNYLKNRFQKSENIIYVTKEGDTPKSIANTIYGDSRFEYLIAYFSGANILEAVRPGLSLNLPVIENPPPPKQPYSKKSVKKATVLFNQGNYTEAITEAECILGQDPTDKKAYQILNESCYKLGVELFRKKQYEDAKEVFDDLGEDYKNVKQMLAYIQKHSDNLAETHYQKGVNLFLADKYEDAIKQWEETLRLNPKHKKAKRELKKTRNLLKKLKNVE